MKPYQIENIASLARLNLTAYQIEQLGRLSKRLKSLDTAACNGTITEEQHERRTAAAMVRVAALIADARPRLSAYHQTDPRGVALYVGRRGLNDRNYTSNGVTVNF